MSSPIRKTVNRAFSILLLFHIPACNKGHNYKACFTTDKDTFSVGEKAVFKNCSDYDGGSTYCLWDLGEGPSSRIGSTEFESVTYIYSYSGNKTITLLIGEKEMGMSDTRKVIHVK